MLLAAGLFGCDSAPTESGTPAAKPAASAPAGGAATDPAEPPPASKDDGSCPSFADLDVKSLPALPQSEYSSVLDEVWGRVLEKYYDPTIGCLDWPGIRVEFGKKVAAAESSADAYRLMNEMLGRLEQSHFQLHAPEGGDEDEDEAQGAASPDVQVRYIEDKLVVVHSGVKNVATGSELVAVDGRDTKEIIERAKTKANRPAELAFKAGRGAAAWMSCGVSGETHDLTLQTAAGKISNAKVECRRAKGELVTLGNLSNIPTRVTHRMVDGTKVGVLAFNIWMLPMLPRISAALGELRAAGMTSLVLDLRGNPGGVGPMAVSVGRLLLTDKASLGKLQYRKFAQDFKVVPDKGSFGGPIAILVDEGTASTSEIFAAGMVDIGRATVVGGGPSAGAALPSVIESLPGGGILQYAVGDYHSPNGTVVEGKGVVPNTVVPERQADFATPGRDPVLDAAVKQLKSQAPSP